MAGICTTDIWNVDSTTLRPGRFLAREKIVALEAANEDDEFLMGTEDIWPRHVESQRMIKSDWRLFRETTLDRGIEAMVETVLWYMRVQI